MLVRLYNLVNFFFHHAKKTPLKSEISCYRTQHPNQLKNQLQQIALRPGQAVFFWNKRIRRVDHIAIVPSQDKKQLNLLEAKLVHAIPPSNKNESDYSGVSTWTAVDFIGNLNKTYSRIIVGSLAEASAHQLQKAGAIAKEVSITKKIDNKVALYSLPLISNFCYVKWFDFDTHLKFKIGIPYLVAKKETGRMTGWMATYCGDLVGRIFQQAGITDLPKINFLGQSYFRSSAFYDHMKENGTIDNIIMWNDKTPNKY